MTTAAEAAAAKTELAGDLAAGVNTLSLNQTVQFTKYVKLVLPLDGFVFWVRADLVSASALYNAARLNAVAFNQSPSIVTPAPTVTAKGSLHYATDMRQEEQSTYAVNRVVFTSEQEVNDLNEIGPDVLFLGEFDGVRFAFSNRGSFYRQAALWHYTGNAVYSELETQIIDDVRAFDTRNVVVSNSLPLWLALNNYQPFYGFGNQIPLYPSFLLPQNLPPPYGSVHIAPEATRALTGAPQIGATSSHSQLCADRVRVTLFGTRNFSALDFVDCVLQRSLDYDEFGIMNMPAVRDEKRTQNELNAIAQKKSVEFEISYYQNRMNDIARQIIAQAIPTYVIGDQVAA